MEERDYFNFSDLKKKLRLYRNFCTYYKKEFIPITVYEKSDRDKTFQRFEIFKMLLFTVVFALSGRIRNAILEIRKLPEDTFTASLLHRTSNGIFIFLLGHMVGLKFIYGKTLYVRLRLAHESKIKYDRSHVKELLDEYPFRHKEDFLYSDLEVRNRITHFDRKIKRNQGELKTQEEIQAFNRKKNAKFIIEHEKD